MSVYHGQCHCKQSSFELTAEPEFQFVCYCSDCRVINSGGHLSGLIFSKQQFKPAEKTQQYVYKGGSGSDIILHSCPNCATHLYAFPTAYTDKVAVRANTLPEELFSPEKKIFQESAFCWDK